MLVFIFESDRKTNSKFSRSVLNAFATYHR